MTVLASTIKSGSEEFSRNAASMTSLVSDLREKVAKISLGGDERARKNISSGASS